MTNETLVGALLLGILEGLTEFLPVSSTGHLLLAGYFLDFKSTGKSFEILIQLGAILALLGVYFSKLLSLAMALPRSSEARNFVIAILLAFLPAAILGVLAHGFIKSVLFETPTLICITLLLGGFVLLYVDGLDLKTRYKTVEQIPWTRALAIGICQCLAMVPGVSRSGATIVGAMLLGSDKRTAAEFSFFLAMPTMAGAFTYDLYKNYALLSSDDISLIGIGFVAAFISALIVVRWFLGYVSKHGFKLFAWWRIGVGAFGLVALYLL